MMQLYCHSSGLQANSGPLVLGQRRDIFLRQWQDHNGSTHNDSVPVVGALCLELWSCGVCAFEVLGAFICAEGIVGAEDMWRPKLSYVKIYNPVQLSFQVTIFLSASMQNNGKESVTKMPAVTIFLWH